VATKKKSATKSNRKVAKVMREYKHGDLKSAGRAPVKSRKQAIAIALNEAREAGAKVPRKKAATKKKSAARKKSTARKTTARKRS